MKPRMHCEFLLSRRQLNRVDTVTTRLRGDTENASRRSGLGEHTMAFMTSTAREAAMTGTGISEVAAKESAAETRRLLQNPSLPLQPGVRGAASLNAGARLLASQERCGRVCAFGGRRRGAPFRTGPRTGVIASATTPRSAQRRSARGWLRTDPGVKAMLQVRMPLGGPQPPLSPTLSLSCVACGCSHRRPSPPMPASCLCRSMAMQTRLSFRAAPGAPHGRLAAFQAAPVVVTAVTAKQGAASRVYGGARRCGLTTEPPDSAAP